MNKMLLICPLLLILLSNNSLIAGVQAMPDSTVKYYLLDEAFVSVDRAFLPIVVSEYGLPVTLLSTRDAEASHINNAYELLSRIPGVNYQRSRVLVHGMGPNAKGSYRIRGIGSKPGAGLMIMVDGRPQYMGFWDHPILDNHPIDDIERVEAVKGPGSVLYGKEAFGGVINLITRQPRIGMNTGLSASGGSFGNQSLQLNHSQGTDRFSYRFNGSMKSTDGFRDNSEQEANSGSGRITHNLNENLRVEFGGQVRQVQWLDPGTIDDPRVEDDSTNGGEFSSFGMDITLNNTYESSHGQVVIYGDLLENEQYLDSKNKSNNLGVRFWQSWDDILNVGELRLGFDYEKYGGSWEMLDGSAETESFEYNSAPYLHLKKDLGSWLHLSGGLRVNFNSKFDTEPAYRLGISADVDDNTKAYVSLAKAFRTPSLAVQNAPFWRNDVSVLEPENQSQAELGVQKNIANRFIVDISYFYAEGSNLIQRIGPPPAVDNSGKFLHRGVELSVRADLSQHLSAYVAYAFMNPGENTAYNPDQPVFSELSYRFAEQVRLSVTLDYSGGRYEASNKQSALSDIMLLNSRFSTPIPIMMRNFRGEAFVAINNIFDSDEYVAEGYPTPGRQFNLGLKILHSVQ